MQHWETQRSPQKTFKRCNWRLQKTELEGKRQSSSRLKGVYSWKGNQVNYLSLKLSLFSFEFIFYFFCIFCCIFIPCNLPLKSSNLQTQTRQKEQLLRCSTELTCHQLFFPSWKATVTQGILWINHSISLWKEV